MDVTQFFRKDFATLDPYAPVKPLDVLAKELGLKIEDLVKLDANENLYGPLPQITRAIADCGAMHIYPDPSQAYLRRDIAEFLGCGVTDAMVCAGTGSDELLDLVLRLFDPLALVNLPPTFGMYPFLGKIAKAHILNVDRGPAPDFALDLVSIAAAVAAGATVVFVASPNNPTGGMLSHAEVEQLCALRAVIVVDEAYAEFAAPGSSAVGLVASLPNLIVMRTFSKWAGLAGLRVGFAVSAPAVNAAIMAIKQPYNVNVAADVGARAALAHAPEIMRTQVRPMLVERDRIIARLGASGWLTPYPSSSNFVLFHVHPPFVAAEVVASLRAVGVLVRYYPTGRLAGCFRVSAGRPRDTDRLLAALEAIAAEQRAKHGACLSAPCTALIFDMDGVLVEVSGSYRAAIVATAAAFGVTVTAADIDAVKAAGGANNDWAVTLCLIRQLAPGSPSATSPPSLEEVTAKFEALYQGDPNTGAVGLKSTETALISKRALAALRARLPGGLAVVTGRPRRDAWEAITRYGWDGLFDAVVCMEDASLKPDPAPVTLAVSLLRAAYARRHPAAVEGHPVMDGSSAIPGPVTAAAALITPARCAMIGDTVDDIRAAVAAGVQAVGAFPPDKAPGFDAARAAKLRTLLTDAGAAMVLEPGCEQLLVLVPPLENEADLWAANAARVAAFGANSAREAAAVAAVAAASASSSAVAALHSSAAAGAASASSSACSRLTIGTAVGRSGSSSRVTKETSIYAWVNIDGTGESEISTGVGFLDHMLSAFAKHGHFDVVLRCKGDTWIDDHHTAEDSALALGEAFDAALGPRKAIRRWGSACCPLDEALSRAVIDISSRPWAEVNLDLKRDAIGTLSTEMVPHVLVSFAQAARITLHVDVLRGRNDHHKAEASFKAVGVALREAVSHDAGGGVPSTKGVLA